MQSLRSAIGPLFLPVLASICCDSGIWGKKVDLKSFDISDDIHRDLSAYFGLRGVLLFIEKVSLGILIPVAREKSLPAGLFPAKRDILSHLSAPIPANNPCFLMNRGDFSHRAVGTFFDWRDP